MRKLVTTATAATILMSLTVFAEAQMDSQTNRSMQGMSSGMSGKMMSKRMKMHRMMTNTSMRGAHMRKSHM